MFSVYFSLQLECLLLARQFTATYSVCVSALLGQHCIPASDSYIPIYSVWASHLSSCLRSHHVPPAESFLWLARPSALTTHFQSAAPVCPFFNLAARTSPPHRSLLLHQTFPHQSTCFPPSLSLHATQGNDSITYDPIHLLMMFGHSKAHLRLTQSSSHSLCSSLGVSLSWVKQQGSPLWDRPDMHICVFLIPPLRLFPTFRIFGDLEPVTCLFLTVWSAWFKRAMCQEKHMALVGMKPPAAGPVRAVLKSLGIKEYNDWTNNANWCPEWVL